MAKDLHFLFFSNQIIEKALILNSDEVAHLAQVLRFQEGDEIQVTNGKGTIYTCKIERMKRDSALCSILSQREAIPVVPKINAYVGVPDKERFDQICEMLPPLNVHMIIPIITDHCRKPWWATRWEKSQSRCERKVISSMKQSMNPFQTAIHAPIEFSEALENLSGITLYGDEQGEKLAALCPTTPEEINLFVGPPGGFSNIELERLTQIGKPLSLGAYRMRTELAVVAAASLLGQL